MTTKLPFRPTGNLVMVELRKIEEKTAGGIVLPGSVTDKHQMAETTGKLVDIGQTAAAHPRLHDIMVGDTVLFPRYSGHHYPYKGVDYWIMDAQQILGKVEIPPDYLFNAAESTKDVFGVNEPVAA